MAQVVPAVIPPLHERPEKNTICLFDVDGTLSPARRSASPEMLALLARLRHQVAIGFVGGSDLAKQQQQLGTDAIPATSLFDFGFSENGLVAFRMGQPLAAHSFIKWIGEAQYQQLANFCLRYIADLDIPVKRGTFVEFRNGMVNISPVGRNCSQSERDDFEKFDLQHGVRPQFIKALKANFPDLACTYSIGGQISFDVFPTGWDKTYCLQHIEAEAGRAPPENVTYSKIHFFGDKTYQGGNDYELFVDKRVIGHSVKDPADTMRQIKELFPSVA